MTAVNILGTCPKCGAPFPTVWHSVLPYVCPCRQPAVCSTYTTSAITLSPPAVPVPAVTPHNPVVAWKWRKWTFGVWSDPANWTWFGIDVGPLEIVWRSPGYRP